MKKTLLAVLSLTAVSLAGVNGQVSYTTGNYTQNFDSLPNTGNATWTNGSTLAGWFAIAPLTTPTTVTSQTGSGTTGLLASFGANTNPNRSLGWVFANALGVANTRASIGFGLTNSNPFIINEFTLGYVGRQWRANSTTPGTLTVEYKLGGSFDNNDNGWTSLSALTFTGPNTTGTTSVDGYLSANTAALSESVSSLSWESGTTLWVRWRDTNDSGTDAQLAIDDVSFASVPEPSTWALIGLGSAFVLWRLRRKAVI